MFRGFTRKELHLAMAFVALIGAGRLVDSARTKNQYQFQYSGRAIEHQPGELVDNPVPSLKTEPRAAAPPDVALIDLNTASAESIESLPGIGPSKAKAIVEWRESNGGFRTIDDLDGVPGIGLGTIGQLRSYVTIKDPPPPMVEVAVAETPEPTSPPTPVPLEPTPGPAPTPLASPATMMVNINKATMAELDTLDGIGPQLAARILENRAAHGPFQTVDDLQRVKGIGPKLMERNRHRLSVH